MDVSADTNAVIVPVAAPVSPASSEKKFLKASEASQGTAGHSATYPQDGSFKKARPSYAVIHARPLPLVVYPLPDLVPHNPLSLLFFTCAFLKQFFFPPTSHPRLFRGYFSALTRSVHVTEEDSMRGLWESGFFGKGTLSRSEPSWLHREQRRLGFTVEETAEEVTARRRAERKAFKSERANKEREERERQHGGASKDIIEATADPTSESGVPIETSPQTYPTPPPTPPTTTPDAPEARVPQPNSLVNQEHLQLELYEAFFAVYALGVLQVYDADTDKPISNVQLFKNCLTHAKFPPISFSPMQITPDSPFLVTYAAYHHFRSLGWVVRNGVKFGADILLYQRGPVFAHAEFAVLVIPSYAHPCWQSSEAKSNSEQKRPKPWHWLHMVNRVQANVHKTLVLCYVNIPPPDELESLWTKNGTDELDIGRLLKCYEVREIVIRRWVPNRNRD